MSARFKQVEGTLLERAGEMAAALQNSPSGMISIFVPKSTASHYVNAIKTIVHGAQVTSRDNVGSGCMVIMRRRRIRAKRPKPQAIAEDQKPAKITGSLAPGGARARD